MADIVGSFSRGIDLGNKVVKTYQDQQDREAMLKRKDTLEGREDTLWDQSQSDYKQGLKDKEQARKEHKEDRARQKVIQGREDWQFGAQKEDYSYQKKERQRLHDERLIQNHYQQSLSAGHWVDIDDETKKAYENNPTLKSSLFNSDSKEFRDGYLASNNVMKRITAGDLPDGRDPELLVAGNFMLEDLIKSGDLPPVVNGQNVLDREISEITATPQGYAMMQKITLEDGSVIERPVTLNRSENEDDPVMTIKPEKFVDKLALIAKSQSMISMFNPEQTREFYRLHWGDSAYGAGGKPITNKRGGRSGSRSGSGSGSSASDYTKEYKKAEQNIQMEYNKRIADVHGDMMLSDEEKQQKIATLQRLKDEALDENNAAWEQYTIVNDSGVGKQKRLGAANKIISGISRKYGDYDIDFEAKEGIREILMSGKSSPQEIDEVIQSMIESGQIKSHQSYNESNNASSIMGGFKENQVKSSTPALQQDPWGNQAIPAQQPPQQTGLADR